MKDWYEDLSDEGDDYPLDEYEMAANPNDFNVLTITNFIDRGVVKIPNFQRNYVWDINRASRLIESLLIGLPVPQIFFYEDAKNSYLVIDGQQRLMTIYYYIKGRFPREEKRVELRKIFSEKGTLPNNIMADDEYFRKFNLRLPAPVPNQKNKFSGKNYETLVDYKLSFDLRTIRSIIVKPVIKNEESEDSAIFELFNRLNTGGVNLGDQEIRASIYHSDFMMLLNKLNNLSGWRNIIGTEIDIHMRDIEILLRCFSFLFEKDSYTKSVKRFLNNFAKKSKKLKKERLEYLENLFIKFDNYLSELDGELFRTKTGRFGTLLFENIFYYSLEEAIKNEDLNIKKFTAQQILTLKNDAAYSTLLSGPSSNTEATKERYELAKKILGL
ncbi:DUF262 domain-containing protein [Leptospira sp. WS39.C2]